MSVLRTPDERFENIEDFDFEPRYLDIQDPEVGVLRMHYLDEGPSQGRVVLCLHGEPTWCYLWRKMIPILNDAGLRVIAPDLIGFGRSDKLSERNDYTYVRHVDWMKAFLARLDLRDITLVGQDWGGLIGLRLVAEDEDRFSAFVLSNTALPTGDQGASEAFKRWRDFSQHDPEFDIGDIVNLFGHGQLSESEIDVYRAPFPDETFKSGARQFPVLVPVSPDDPASEDNRRAWLKLTRWERPALMCFSDADPVTAGAEQPFMKLVPGARGQPHVTLSGRHFIQEEDGERWAHVIADWMKAG